MSTHQIKQKQITLESGTTFLVNKWSFTKALGKATKFAKVLGHPVTMLLSSASENGEEINILENLPDFLFVLCSNLEETPLEQILKELLEGTLKYNENGANPSTSRFKCTF